MEPGSLSMKKMWIGLLVLAACSASGPTAPPDTSLRDPMAALEQWNRLTPEEQEWAKQHPQAAQRLGDMSTDERKSALEQYQNLPPAMQQRVRENPEAYIR